MPLREMVQNMQGLAALAEQRGQVKLQEEQMAKQKAGMEALNQYIETEKNGMPDMSLFYKAVTAVPDAAGNVLKGIGIDEKRKAKDASRFIMEAAPLVENREAFLQKLNSRIDFLRQNGRNPSESEMLREQYLAGDVAGVKNNMKGVAGALVGTGNLDPKAYEFAFGAPEEKMNEYQKASIDIKNKELGLDSQRLGLEQQRLATGIGQLTADERNWNRYQELLNADPKQARQFGVAKGFVSNEGQKLSVFDSKVIDTASNEYTKLNSAASNYRVLADKIKAANLTSGAMGTLQELGKEFLGEQDTNTGLRKAVAQIVASEASKNLNPGSTTEKEYAIAREPMPTGKANSEYVARWLTAVANVAEHNAKFQEHKAQFISKNGGQRDPDTGETVLSSWKRIQAEQTPTDTGQLFKDADAIIGGQ